jgi:uncharacterized protein YjbI with pentapeptide repeats
MFNFVPCAAGCGRPVISGAELCAMHLADPAGEGRRIADYISAHDVIKNLSAPGICFQNADFSATQYFSCNFIEASFQGCLFSGAFMRMGFFDFVVFRDCDFSKSDLQFVSFAGATFEHCTFEDSELTHVNYGGCTILDCTFNNSNLYNSRFISARITNTEIKNCNLQRANFTRIQQEAVSFKSSNTAEAIMDDSGNTAKGAAR